MERVVLAREDRTGLPGAVAHGDDVVERLVEVLGHRLAAGRRPIDPDLGKDTDRVGVHALRFRPGRESREIVSAVLPEQGLGDLAAGRVAGADEEDADRMIGHLILLDGPARLGRGGDRDFQVGELGIEPVEVVALARHRGALLGDEWRKVEVNGAAPQADGGEPSCVGGRHAEAAQGKHEPEAGEIALVVVAIPVRAPRCDGQDTRGLVPAHGRAGYASPAREFGDLHERNVHLQVGSMSSEEMPAAAGAVNTTLKRRQQPVDEPARSSGCRPN